MLKNISLLFATDDSFVIYSLIFIVLSAIQLDGLLFH